MYEPAVLMENIEKRMAASDCTDKDKELLKGLLESLDEMITMSCLSVN